MPRPWRGRRVENGLHLIDGLLERGAAASELDVLVEQAVVQSLDLPFDCGA
jgi:hypothetical protein